MSNKSTTRRDVLRKAALAGGLVAIPGVAGAIATARAEAAPASEIGALAPRWRALVEAWHAAEVDYLQRGEVYDALKPKRPAAAYANRFFIRHCGGYRHWFVEPIPGAPGSKMRYRSFGNAEKWEAAARMLSEQGDGKAARKAEKRAQIMRAHEAAVVKANAETGFTLSYEAAAALAEEMNDLEERILSLPAIAVTDLGVKAAVLNRQFTDEETDGEHGLVSFVAEVARFADAA